MRVPTELLSQLRKCQYTAGIDYNTYDINENEINKKGKLSQFHFFFVLQNYVSGPLSDQNFKPPF